MLDILQTKLMRADLVGESLLAFPCSRSIQSFNTLPALLNQLAAYLRMGKRT